MTVQHPGRILLVIVPLFVIATVLIFNSRPPGPLIDFNNGMSIDELHRKADLKTLAVAPAYDYF
jgi:hypothetical protein